MASADTDGGFGGGPTIRRMLLGARLRRLREAKGVSREGAGYLIRGSDSKISRMELGRVGSRSATWLTCSHSTGLWRTANVSRC